MTIREWFRKFLVGDEPKSTKLSEDFEEKRSRIWGADVEFGYANAVQLLSSIPQPSKLRTYTGYVEEYGNNIWVYAAVYLKATSLASVKWILYQRPKYKRSNAPKIIESHHLINTLNFPNPFMSGFDLREAIGAGLELTGNAYLEEVYDKKGELSELYPLQPQKMEIVPDVQTLVNSYIYKAIRDVKFTADEITHIKYFNPKSDFYGQAAMTPAEYTVSTNNFAREWNRNFFKNSALPIGVLESENTINPSIIKRLKTQWKSAHKGVAKAHDIAILEGGLKWRDISFKPKDMDFKNLTTNDRDEIFAAFGVYAPLFGMVENVNNSTLIELKKLFWENTMLPMMEKIEAALNINLIWPVDDSLYLAFDKDSIEALKGSQETRARIAAMLVDRGVYTINEARQKFFTMPPVKWGDVWYMPLNLIPVERAGEGMGTGSGGESGVPGQQTGRPPKERESIKKRMALVDKRAKFLNKVKLLENPSQTLDEDLADMPEYNGVNEADAKNRRKITFKEEDDE